jgi:hypothetical protein
MGISLINRSVSLVLSFAGGILLLIALTSRFHGDGRTDHADEPKPGIYAEIHLKDAVVTIHEWSQSHPAEATVAFQKYLREQGKALLSASPRFKAVAVELCKHQERWDATPPDGTAPRPELLATLYYVNKKGGTSRIDYKLDGTFTHLNDTKYAPHGTAFLSITPEKAD